MITGIKHQAIVGKDGKLEISASGFPEGTTVEVIVLMDDVMSDHKTFQELIPSSCQALLEALDRVEARQNLVTFTPEEWNAKYNV